MIYDLKNVEKSLGDFHLMIEKCQLEAGKIYVVTGPNGCGKTTFLNLLAFLDNYSQGELIFKGKTTRGILPQETTLLRRKIGYLMQNSYLFNMSVYENVSYPLKIRNVSENLINDKVEHILSKMSLTHLSKRNVHKLSGGEAQRTALARTLIIDADVFLLDEPTANVDITNIHAVEKMILNINKERSAAVVIATHSQEQAYRLSPNIISIIKGKIKDIAYENVFSGTVIEKNDIKYMELSKDITIQLSESGQGENTIAIDPQDIIISYDKFKSSALNNFYGTIEKIENINGSLRVFINTGVTFCAVITHKSFHDMGLNIGKRVCLTFKANSVKVL